MDISGICLNCFSQRGKYDVCPYCGYVNGTIPEEGYILHPGVRLWGRYVIGTILGAGGFGITYRAWDTRLNAMVAIKEFYPQGLVSRIPGETDVRVFSGDKQENYAAQLARFMDEAKNMAKFTGDAYIVSVLDYFEDNGTAYIVMEYLDGMTLKEYMAQKGGSLSTDQAVSIGSSLLKALQTIHQKGIIHRDISPDNIFVLHDGSIKVLDFGAARFAAKEGSDLTQGVVVKKGYAPPEQYRTNMKQGMWTDIYAAGATLYKMITGVTPEESIERTEKDVLKRPSQTGRAVDAGIDKTVMKAMALRPELRFKSAAAMLAALEQRTVCDFPEEELKKRKKRNGILVAVSLLLVVGMASLVAWQASRQPQTLLGGPALDVDSIEPDTITILVPIYPSNYSNPTGKYDQMSQMAEAFSERYPQHTVVVESYEYDSDGYNGMTQELIERFYTEEAPAIFSHTLPSAEHDYASYQADLSTLYASLNTEDYLFLQEYATTEKELYDGAVYDIPLGISTYVALFDRAGAAERGIQIPAAVDSMDTLMQWEMNMPGTVNMSSFDLENLLQRLRPDIWENKNLDELEDLVVEYANLYYAGYFNRDNQEIEENGGYQYSDYMVIFSDNNSYLFESTMETADTVPVVTNGKILCGFSDYYHVSCYISENQQKLAMLFLHFALSEYGQHLLHVQIGCEIPIQKAALEQYTAVNSRLAYLTDEFADKLEVKSIGYRFSGLYDLLETNASEAEIRALIEEEFSDWN